MEKDTNLFGLSLDSFAATQLREAAKWARFLAIAGLISMLIIIIYSLVVTLSLNSSQRVDRDFDSPAYTTGYYIGVGFGILLIAVIYVLPCYFLLRFSNKMIVALDSSDNATLIESFRNLKITFRYIGILTIIFTVLFAIGVLGNLG